MHKDVQIIDLESLAEPLPYDTTPAAREISPTNLMEALSPN